MRAPARTRADEVVDLLARGPGGPGPEAELFVERADGREQLPAQEDRERDRAVPEVLHGERRRVGLPRTGRAAVGGDSASGQTVSADVGEQAPGYPLEQVVRVRAVVVGKGDEIGGEMGERRIPRA